MSSLNPANLPEPSPVPLLAVFAVTFAIVYIVQARRGAIMLDRLHRATLFAMAATFVVVAAAILLGD